MCGRITIIEFDELYEIARAIEYSTSFNAHSDQPMRKNDAFPNAEVPLFIVQSPTDDHEQVEERDWNRSASNQGDPAVALRIVPVRKRWGFETQNKTQVVFNARIETASESPLWKDSLEQRRCIVPVRAFYETHASEMAIDPRTGRTKKQSYRFTAPEGILLIAGIWKAERFSIITTAPNESVSAVHDRMPLVLSRDDAREWLVGDWRNVPKTVDTAFECQPLYTPQSTVEQQRLF